MILFFSRFLFRLRLRFIRQSLIPELSEPLLVATVKCFKSYEHMIAEPITACKTWKWEYWQAQSCAFCKVNGFLSGNNCLRCPLSLLRPALKTPSLVIRCWSPTSWNLRRILAYAKGDVREYGSGRAPISSYYLDLRKAAKTRFRELQDLFEVVYGIRWDSKKQKIVAVGPAINASRANKRWWKNKGEI